MLTVGSVDFDKIRSNIVGNASHFFVITMKKKESEGSQSSEEKENTVSEDESPEFESLSDSDDEFQFNNVPSLPSYHLYMYDRHSLSLIKSIGQCSSGIFSRLYLVDNTLATVNKTSIYKKV